MGRMGGRMVALFFVPSAEPQRFGAGSIALLTTEKLPTQPFPAR